MQKWVGYCELSRILRIRCNGSRYTESDGIHYSVFLKDCHNGLFDYEYWEPYGRGLWKGSIEDVYRRGLWKGSIEDVYRRGLWKGSMEGVYRRGLWKGSIEGLYLLFSDFWFIIYILQYIVIWYLCWNEYHNEFRVFLWKMSIMFMNIENLMEGVLLKDCHKGFMIIECSLWKGCHEGFMFMIIECSLWRVVIKGLWLLRTLSNVLFERVVIKGLCLWLLRTLLKGSLAGLS